MFPSFPFLSLLPFVSFYVPVVSSYFCSFPFLLTVKTAGRAAQTASSAYFLFMLFSFPGFSVCCQFLLQIKTARRAALKIQVLSFPFMFTCFLYIILHSFLFKFFSCSFPFPLTFFYVCSLPLFLGVVQTAGRAAIKSNASHFLFISFHFSCHLWFPCVSVYVPSISLHFPFVFFSFCSFPFLIVKTAERAEIKSTQLFSCYVHFLSFLLTWFSLSWCSFHSPALFLSFPCVSFHFLSFFCSLFDFPSLLLCCHFICLRFLLFSFHFLLFFCPLFHFPELFLSLSCHLPACEARKSQESGHLCYFHVDRGWTHRRPHLRCVAWALAGSGKSSGFGGRCGNAGARVSLHWDAITSIAMVELFRLTSKTTRWSAYWSSSSRADWAVKHPLAASCLRGLHGWSHLRLDQAAEAKVLRVTTWLGRLYSPGEGDSDTLRSIYDGLFGCHAPNKFQELHLPKDESEDGVYASDDQLQAVPSAIRSLVGCHWISGIVAAFAHKFVLNRGIMRYHAVSCGIMRYDCLTCMPRFGAQCADWPCVPRTEHLRLRSFELSRTAALCQRDRRLGWTRDQKLKSRRFGAKSTLARHVWPNNSNKRREAVKTVSFLDFRWFWICSSCIEACGNDIYIYISWNKRV